MGDDLPLAHCIADNLVEGKRKRRSNINSPATPTTSSSSSTTPTRKIPESPRATTGVPSGKRKLVTSEEERSPAKRGRKSATVKPGECSLLPPLFPRPRQNAGSSAGEVEPGTSSGSFLITELAPAHAHLSISQQSPVGYQKGRQALIGNIPRPCVGSGRERKYVVDFRQTHRRCSSSGPLPSSGTVFLWKFCSPLPCVQDPLAFPHVLLKAGTLACVSPFHTNPQTIPFQSLKLHISREVQSICCLLGLC